MWRIEREILKGWERERDYQYGSRITTDYTDIKGIIREYYINNFTPINSTYKKVKNSLKRHKLPKLTKEEIDDNIK